MNIMDARLALYKSLDSIAENLSSKFIRDNEISKDLLEIFIELYSFIENLNVNPTFLLLGKGDIFFTEESEIDKLRKENLDLVIKHNTDEITILQFKEAIDKLEKRNNDLIDISSAAIQYHKTRQGDTQTSKIDKEIDDNTAIKVLKQLGLMNENDTELNLSKIKSSITRKRK